MATNVNTLTTKLNGRGVHFMDFFHKSSPLFSAIFYDWDSLRNPTQAIRPKQIQTMNELLDDGYTIRWRDTDLRRESTLMNGAASATDTTIDVDDASIFGAGDNIFLPAYSATHTITAISSNTLTITPAVPTGGYADNSKVLAVSTSIDNKGAVNGKNTFVPVGGEVTNYIQHISHRFELEQEELNKILLKYTTIGLNEKQAVVKYVQDKTQHTIRQVQTDIVNAFWVGKKDQQTINSNIHRFTGGINEFISETVDCTDSTDKARLLKIIDALDAMQGITNMKGEFADMLVCTRRAKSRISNLAAQYTTGIDTIEIAKIGFRIDVLRTTYGDIPVYVDPILTHLYDDANVAFTFNPKMVTMNSTSYLPANKQTKPNDSNAIGNLTGIIFHKDETATKQPNSPAVMNAYTNIGFKFQGSSLGLYKKLINLGE